MAFSATNVTTDPRSFSIGPVKAQRMTYSVASGDTGGTITASNLRTIYQVIVTGPAGQLTAATTYSGNTATIAFVNPGATRYGEILVLGV